MPGIAAAWLERLMVSSAPAAQTAAAAKSFELECSSPLSTIRKTNRKYASISPNRAAAILPQNVSTCICTKGPANTPNMDVS